MLARSHERLLEEADGLCAALARSAPLDEIASAVSFFEHQGVRHERDEEESLFPRLRDRVASSLFDELTRQHRAHESMCARLRELVERDAPERAASLAEVAESLRQSYRDHIALEEAALLPAAASLLGADELAAIYEEMQARRGR
jgi:hemerythrin-like domain-containing protein